MKVLDIVGITDESSEMYGLTGQIVKMVETMTTLPNSDMTGVNETNVTEIHVFVFNLTKVIKCHAPAHLEIIPAKPASRTTRTNGK